ncbi:MAG TPA: hypothetical protein VMM55_04360 [Thermohalobaculum sp.]|nr:hypothetical protein [Thermohalobaculum sp.]
MTMIKNFLHDETGAVTIDWVALTAGILLLGIAVVFSIFNNGVSPLVENINAQLEGASAGICGSLTGGGISSADCDAVYTSN